MPCLKPDSRTRKLKAGGNCRTRKSSATVTARSSRQPDGSSGSRCPCCPKDAKPDLERLATKQALEELMGDDEDGLAATFEDYRL
jgi:hypothetical protein